MARATKVPCPSCDRKLIAGESFCGSCGKPTQWATHDERVRWEVAQWRRAREGDKPAIHAPSPPPRRRRLRGDDAASPAGEGGVAAFDAPAPAAESHNGARPQRRFLARKDAPSPQPQAAEPVRTPAPASPAKKVTAKPAGKKSATKAPKKTAKKTATKATKKPAATKPATRKKTAAEPASTKGPVAATHNEELLREAVQVLRAIGEQMAALNARMDSIEGRVRQRRRGWLFDRG